MSNDPVYSVLKNIKFGEYGGVSVHLSGGISVPVPGVAGFHIASPEGTPHAYRVENLVGFTDGNRSLDNIFDFPPSLNPTSLNNAFTALRHKHAPSFENIQQGAAVKNHEITDIPFLGPAKTLVFHDQRMIVNITIPGHELYPGVVVRFIEERNGQIYVVTEAYGTGKVGGLNTAAAEAAWGATDHDIQALLVKYGKNPIPEELSFNPRCFAAGTLVETVPGNKSRIETLKLNDKVLAFSSVTGAAVPARVTQIHETPDQPVIDFHGTKVTPGHVYACPDGEYRQLGAVLMADAYLVDAEGQTRRARTNEVVSAEDFALRQAMFGPSGVPVFEGVFAPDAAEAAPYALPQSGNLPLGKAEIPSMAPDIHAGAIGGAYTGGVAAPATAFGAPVIGTSPFGSGGAGAPPIAFDPWDYSRPAPDGYTLPWVGRGVKNRASPDVPPTPPPRSGLLRRGFPLPSPQAVPA